MKLLVVEDELDTLDELRDLIHNYDKDLEIEVCSNPLHAIQLCRNNSFQAAFLDIQMPEMTGLELAEHLSSLSPEISFVFVSAYNNFATEAFEVNAIDYILKPVRQERLNKALDKIRKEHARKEARNKAKSSHVTIQAFGKMVVSCGDMILKWKRRKSSEIFAYLLHQQGIPVHKEKLCEMMWPDFNPQKSLTYLQTIMYQLRKNISEIGGNSITIEYADHCYRLCLNAVCYDVALFSDAYERAFQKPQPSVKLLMEAEQLYTGAYFEEDGWLWAYGKQQDLALKYEKILELIIRLEMKEEHKEGALFYIRKWAGLNIYRNQDYYLRWVESHIGKEEAERLKPLFFDDDSD